MAQMTRPGIFEDTCTLFAPNWGFSRSANRMVSFKFTPDLVAMATNHRYLDRKLACMEDTTSIPAPSRGFSGSANLTVLMKLVTDQTLLPWQRKFENFNRKFAITRIVWEIQPLFLDLVGGNWGRRI